jgi:hypothetical protein
LTASRNPREHNPFTTPLVDYEPPPVGATACPPPTSAAPHRHTRIPLRSVDRSVRPAVREAPPPPAAAVFADAALRRVLEVIDRRRPIAQLRPLLVPTLMDTVVSLTQVPSASCGRDGAAVLRRVRLRTVTPDDAEPTAAEVFATYTRGRRVRAIAARVEFVRSLGRAERWQLVALHIG